MKTAAERPPLPANRLGGRTPPRHDAVPVRRLALPTQAVATTFVASASYGGSPQHAPAQPSAATRDDMAFFSPVERLVIGIGDADPAPLLNRNGWLARLRRIVFGIRAPAPFADPRLEALRSLANALRQRRGNPDAQIAAALGAGITLQQVEVLKSRR